MNVTYNPQYLNPVYNPNQWAYESTPFAGPYTNDRYKLKINFVLSAITSGTYFTLDDYQFTFSSVPSQNQLPESSLVIYQEFLYYVKEAFENIPSFEQYQYEIVYTGVTSVNITMIDRELYGKRKLTYSSSTSGITFTQTLVSQRSLGDSKNNYSIWSEIYLKDGYRFNSPYENYTGKTLLATLYKTYQKDNEYIFNYNDILQSYSETDNWNCSNSSGFTGQIFFQKDLNSLKAYNNIIYESYDENFGTSATTIRKFYTMTTTPKYIWDSSRSLEPSSFDSKSYWNTNYGNSSGFSLIQEIKPGYITIEFNYQIPLGDTLFINNGYESHTFTASTFNNNEEFKVESHISGTVNNFKTQFQDVFSATSYTFSTLFKGYSKGYLTISSTTSDTLLDLNVSNSDSGKIRAYEIVETEEQFIFIPQNPFTLIKWLTYRPSGNISIIYSNTSEIYNKQFSLSIFLSALYDLNFDIEASATGFQTFYEGYNDGVWEFIGDGDQYPMSLSGQSNGLYHVNIDPKLFNGSYSYTKYRVKLKVYVTNNDGTYFMDYSEPFEFNNTIACDYETVKSFTFLNSLGGWDYLDVKRDKETNYVRATSMVNNDFNDIITDATTYEQVLQNGIEQTYKLSTLVYSKEEYDWLYEFIKSSRVYLIINQNEEDNDVNDDYLLPIIITSSDFSLLENNNKWLLNFEYRIAKVDVSQKSI